MGSCSHGLKPLISRAKVNLSIYHNDTNVTDILISTWEGDLSGISIDFRVLTEYFPSVLIDFCAVFEGQGR